MDGLDGLVSLRMICKAASCDKRLCMIDGGHAAIGNASGIHQLGHVLHEVVTFTVLGHQSAAHVSVVM